MHTFRVVSSVLLAALLIALCSSWGRPLAAQQRLGGRVIVVGSGGAYQTAQRKALFDPFTKRYGIQVVEDTSQAPEQLEAQVKSGHPAFDVAYDDFSTVLTESAKNLLEPIDYKYFDPADLKALRPEARHKYGVGAAYISLGITYRTDAFPNGGPQSYADVWNVTRFPGKRALPACDEAEGTQPSAEAGVLAAGVPMDKVYPIDIPLSLKKLKELSPNVIWYKNNAQPGQLLVAKEVTIALAPDGRIQQLIDKGAPLKIVWHQTRYSWDMWRVLRGTPNKDNAMRFLAFISTPQPQAELARLFHAAPTNSRAYQLLDAKTAVALPTYPANIKQEFPMNDAWWHQNRDKFIEACLNAVGR